MSRADVQKLVADGRISKQDDVSLDWGPWMKIESFLSEWSKPAVPPSVSSPSDTSPMASHPVPAKASRAKRPSETPSDSRTANVARHANPESRALRVLKADRIYGPMSRDDAKKLLAMGRISNEELICAAGGPWMRVVDFFSERPPEARPAPPPDLREISDDDVEEAPPRAKQAPSVGKAAPKATEEEVAEAEYADEEYTEEEYAEQGYSEEEYTDEEYAEDEEYAQDEEYAEEFAEDEEVVEAEAIDDEFAEAPGNFLVTPPSFWEEKPELSDDWYVRVRGIPSAPLRRLHIRMLLDSKEIDGDCPAAHISWRANQWKTLREIPELARLLN